MLTPRSILSTVSTIAGALGTGTLGLSRLLSFIMIVFVVFVATRAIVRALPGDPLETLIAESGTSIPREVLRAQFNLDQPFVVALVHDLRNAIRGDFGRSLFSRQPIGPVLLNRFLHTALLTVVAMALSLAISLWLGIMAAAKQGSWIDHFCTIYGALGAALPTSWIGPILIIVFAVWIPVFPVGGHLALPAVTLAFGFSSLWARLIRERVRDTLRFGSAPGARARGVPEWKVLLKYGLVPASGALVAYIGTQVGGLLAGAFVIEVIFDWKGMGTLLVDGVLRRDYPVVESATFVTAFVCLLGTFVGDFLQRVIGPWENERYK